MRYLTHESDDARWENCEVPTNPWPTHKHSGSLKSSCKECRASSVGSGAGSESGSESDSKERFMASIRNTVRGYLCRNVKA